MRKIDWKDIAVRSTKTFVEVFLTSLVVDGAFDISDGDKFMRYLVTTCLSSLAAAVAAVWNLLINIFAEKAGILVENIFGKSATDGGEVSEPSDEICETLSDTITESDWTYSDDNNAESEWTSADDGDIMDDEEEVAEDTIDGVDANG